MRMIAAGVILSCAALVLFGTTGCSPDGGKPIPQKKEVKLAFPPGQAKEKGKEAPSELMLKDKAEMEGKVSFAKIEGDKFSLEPSGKGITLEKKNDTTLVVKIGTAADVTAKDGDEFTVKCTVKHDEGGKVEDLKATFILKKEEKRKPGTK